MQVVERTSSLIDKSTMAQNRRLLSVFLVVLCVAVAKTFSMISAPFSSQERTVRSTTREQVKNYLREASDEDLHRVFFDVESSEFEDVGAKSVAVDSIFSSSIKMELLQYDPTAVVAILPGLDGQPGVAGVDDDGNGTVDDRSELGATHSDDRCETMSLAMTKLMSPKPLVLQRGAFVVVNSAHELLVDAEQRVHVSVEMGNQVSEFLIAEDLALFQDADK